MKTKTIFAVLLATACAFSFAACKKDSCTHVDKNDDGKCDACSAEFSDGDEMVSVSFLVETDLGAKVAGAAFDIFNNVDSYTLTTDDNGVAVAELKLGTYSIDYDFDTLPEAHFPDNFDLTVTENTTSVTLKIVDNTPNGSMEKPFFVNDSVTDITLEGGAEVYYVYRSVGIKTLEIENENVTVEYNGTTYAAEDGKVSFVMESKMGMNMVTLCIKNTSSAAISTKMSILSLLGTAIDNPIILTENTATANVTENGMVYYKWTATQSGELVVSSENPLNNISLSNMTTETYSETSNGAASISVMVNAGDEIIIIVATTSGDAQQIVFNTAVQNDADDAE